MAMFINSINKAMAAQPVTNVTITGDNVTLGDVFTGVKEKDAGFVLAPAPTPNTVLTWDARTLNRVARAFDLPWRASSTDRIEIRRLATIIDETDIQSAILKSLKDDGLNAKVDLDFVGQKAQIILSHELQPTIEVISSSYNSSRQTFSATLRTADETIRKFSGVAYPLVAIPVLDTPVRRGDLITDNMIKTIHIRASDLSDDIVLNKNNLVGMTPRRVLTTDTPVSISELDKPRMVDRGDLITMHYKKGPIQITAIAKAMESGTKGDIIRVMNVDSKRTLKAHVTGMREAKIIN
jgi:flagella basal body P-ring formation protein FlgA